MHYDEENAKWTSAGSLEIQPCERETLRIKEMCEERRKEVESQERVFTDNEMRRQVYDTNEMVLQVQREILSVIELGKQMLESEDSRCGEEAERQRTCERVGADRYSEMMSIESDNRDYRRRSYELLFKLWMSALIGTFLICLAFGASLLTGCESGGDQCTDDDTRCSDNVVEFCADGAWLPSDECGEVHMFDGTTEKWECCDREIAVCSPTCKESK